MKPLAYLSLSLLVLAMAGCQKPEMEKTAKQETPPEPGRTDAEN